MSMTLEVQEGSAASAQVPFEPIKKQVRELLEPFHRLYQGDFRKDFESFKWQALGAWHQLKELRAVKLDPTSSRLLDQVATVVACSFHYVYGPSCKRAARMAVDGPRRDDLREAGDLKVRELFPDVKKPIDIACLVAEYRKEMAEEDAKLWVWQRWSLFRQLDDEGLAQEKGIQLERDALSVFGLICD